MNEIRYAARSLIRTPALASALLLTVALGIGANLAVQGFVRGLLAPERPVPHADALVSLFAWDDQHQLGAVPYGTFLSSKDHHEVFEWLGAARESHAAIVLAGRTSLMSIAEVTPDLGAVLQLGLHGGVGLNERIRQLEPGVERGTSIRVDGTQTRVDAIVPETFAGLYIGRTVDVWTTPGQAFSHPADRVDARVWPIGRLRRGVSPARAAAALNESGSTLAVLPYNGMTPDTAAGLGRIRTLLRAAAAAVFSIACANLMLFMLARASARSRATTVRIALGATRARLVMMAVADSAVISFAGGALGALLAIWTTALVPALLFEQDAAHLRFTPDVAGGISVAALCAAITILCGLLPLIEVRRVAPAAVLQRESAGPSRSIARLRSGLVTAQMTLCVLLVVSSALLVSGLRAALRTAAGERLGRPILATLQTRHGFERQDLGLEYFHRAESTVLSVPGITSVAWIGTPPGGSPAWQTLRIEPPNLPEHDIVLDVAAFPEEPDERLKFRLLAGRMFGGSDVPGACPVAMVNDIAARELFENDAVGRVVVTPAGTRVEIVGVVANSAQHAATPVRPSILFAPDQRLMTPDLLGPHVFRVAAPSALTHIVLEANVVSSNFFDAVGWPRLEGGDLQHAALDGCRVAMVDGDAADRYFGGHAAGAAVLDEQGRRTEIIGVVCAAVLRTVQRRAGPVIYYPIAQQFRPRLTMIAGTANADGNVVALVRRRLEGVTGAATTPVVATLDEHLSRTALATERIASVLVGASAAMAVTLGILGLYAATAEAARQRRRETAVRAALGAQRWRIIGGVMAQGGRLALVGGGVGLLGSLVVARWLTHVTPALESPGGWTWLVALAMLSGAVIVASILPARRAIMLNPFNSSRDAG